MPSGGVFQHGARISERSQLHFREDLLALEAAEHERLGSKEPSPPKDRYNVYYRI